MRPRPALLRALGRDEPPSVIQVGNATYRLAEIFKHDSWAATALYRGEDRAIVAKFNREQPVSVVPMRWLGRWLAAREVRALRLLRGIHGVPAEVGAVLVAGKPRATAAAHSYIEGRPLHMDDKPGEEFFARLGRIVAAMHERGLAYVDLNKRENIIVTGDGSPALIDFQLHFAPSPAALRLPFVRRFLRQLQAADVYHLNKHIASHSIGSNISPPRPPFAARIWRVVYVHPVQFVRRRLLVWLRVRDKTGRATGELDPEKAARLALERHAANPSARLPGERRSRG